MESPKNGKIDFKKVVGRRLKHMWFWDCIVIGLIWGIAEELIKMSKERKNGSR